MNRISSYIVAFAIFFIANGASFASNIAAEDSVIQNALTKKTDKERQKAENDSIKQAKKLEKEDAKRKTKELDAVVKSAKHVSKEEKKRINELSILEQDLQNWLRDEQAEWYEVGEVSLYNPLEHVERLFDRIPVGRPGLHQRLKESNIKGTLFVKKGGQLQVRILFEGLTYDASPFVTVIDEITFRWRFKDVTLRWWVFLLPDELETYRGERTPEYKEYSPWQMLIEMENRNKQLEQQRKEEAKRQKALEKQRKKEQKQAEKAAKAKK